MRLLLLLLLNACFVAVMAQPVLPVVPQPSTVKWIDENKTTVINASTQLVLEGSNLEKAAASLNEYLNKYYGFSLKVVKRTQSTNAIRLNYERMDNALPGAYMLRSDEKGVYIAGDNENGVFYGVQTLLQLLPVPNAATGTKAAAPGVPYLYISDAPRFAYRGMHLDVGRHFFPVSFIKKYIDYLALHKFNTFHWHLTEDQGWRIEIKKYPKLTEVGAWREGTIIGRYPGTGNDKQHYGGFYTQEEIKDVVKYAANRYIDIIPEIELPGHSSAAIASYPDLSCFPEEPSFSYFPKNCEWNGPKTGKQVQQTWGVFDDVFCAGKENTFTFIQDVLDEIMTLFPSKYIHVGGDECPKENWKKCTRCQKRMKDEGLTDEHHLQSYFIQRVEKYLNNKGRTLIGWDEILEGGLAPNAVVMSWRGEEGGIQAAREKHKVIMTPGNPVYFDHTQSANEDSVTIGGFNPLEKVYAYEPIPAKLEGYSREFVLGAQANVWTEYMHYPSKVEYMIFPRMSALSEVLWSSQENRNWERFQQKLPTLFKRYELWKASYSQAYYDLRETVLPTPDYNGVIWKLETNQPGTKIEGNTVLPVGKNFEYKEPMLITTNTTANVWAAGVNKKIYREFIFNKATGKKISLANPASSSYPGDGAFTLVNGIQNKAGLARAKEFLGFNGTDCEAEIDLGKKETITKVIIHTLKQHSSWIWQPATLEVFIMDEAGKYVPVGLTDDVTMNATTKFNGTMEVAFSARSTNKIKVVVRNWGAIPDGYPGAGNKAWLFLDEIEVQ
ncbi:MAG: beta-N-acetylhexosaminidase [Bacteroidetes bacterium]|nr:beta-N-acetylhexosaminidase [Bacteroidota bacterium]